MMFTIYIAPHERDEAIEAYREWLSDALITEIREAPEGALIKLVRGEDATRVIVMGTV